jgi:hypothetical protein
MNFRIHFYIDRAISGRKSGTTYPINVEDVNRMLEPAKRIAKKSFEEYKEKDPVYQGAKIAREGKANKRKRRESNGQAIHLFLEACKRKKFYSN